MKKHIPAKANILGDLRAEYDHQMLEKAFYESPDYRSLIESGDRAVIVGRRGAGKSALFYRLKKHWEVADRTTVVTISPEDYETIGLQGVLAPFKDRFNLIRAAAKLGWRYCLMMEVAKSLQMHFKFAHITGIPILCAALKEWNQLSSTVPAKMRCKLERCLAGNQIPELLISELAQQMQLKEITEQLTLCLNNLNQSIYILVDRLDEGYEANTLGIGLIDGLVHSIIDTNRTLPNLKAFIFLRDNMFRTIAQYDVDYSRQIEGQVIRLHWDEYHLLNLIANRFRQAFHISSESSLAVWNQRTCRGIEGRDGFRLCLRLTLFRPRDLLVLLNNAFYHAFQHDNDVIAEPDILYAAKHISETRLADLFKEYQAVFPGIERLARAFSDGPGLWTGSNVRERLIVATGATDLTAEELQHFAILGSPDASLQALYSVGFIGIKQPGGNTFKFCHDGNQTKFTFTESSDCLVHPCYWRSLNIHGTELLAEGSEEIPAAITEIRDEFDIDVTSTTPDIRKHRIGQFISALNTIPQGPEGANRFEDWCHQTIAILFAAGLSNVELKPNKDAVQRRDIVARNQAKTDTWKRILTDYNSRQVIFEVKNYVDIGPSEYRQMNSYLVRDYGKVGFIITRDTDESLRRDKDLSWVKEIYYGNDRLIVKLTGIWLSKYLSKARNPQKHDAADIALGGLLDRYARNYLSLRTK